MLDPGEQAPNPRLILAANLRRDRPLSAHLQANLPPNPRLPTRLHRPSRARSAPTRPSPRSPRVRLLAGPHPTQPRPVPRVATSLAKGRDPARRTRWALPANLRRRDRLHLLDLLRLQLRQVFRAAQMRRLKQNFLVLDFKLARDVPRYIQMVLYAMVFLLLLVNLEE